MNVPGKVLFITADQWKEYRGSKVVAALLAVMVLLAGAGVLAHATKLSSSKVSVGAETVEAEVTVNVADLEAALGIRLRTEETREPDPTLIARAADQANRYVTERTAVLTQAGVTCTSAVGAPTATRDHLVWRISWRCPPVHGGLVYRVTLFHDIDLTVQHMVIFRGEADGRLALLSLAASEVSLAPARASLARVFGRYLVAGIEHIFLGYDHIAFLLGAILWGRRLGPLVVVVTAFTLAHSVTLSLAVLDVVYLPSTLVEALIAASIVYVALENFYVRGIERRWRLTFLFGLVHGFGFAGALRQFGLPDAAIVPALGAFNLGVEVGQLAILFIAVPMLLGFDRLGPRTTNGYARKPSLVYACSGLILMFGIYWLIERTLLA